MVKSRRRKGQTKIYKIFDTKRVTRTSLKTEGELKCSRMLNSSWSTSDMRGLYLFSDITSFE
jgi:hypothetical protein